MLIATHNERFHADEVFAIAALKLHIPECSIIRTRDEKELQKAQIRVDVGSRYDPETLDFDHHQTQGAGVRKNGIPYASFGLVWKHFGEKLCGSIDVAKYLDFKIVQIIDAEDNGTETLKPLFPDLFPYTISDIIASFIPQHYQDIQELDAYFDKAVDFAQHCLEHEISTAKEALPLIQKAIDEADNPKILIMERFDDSWRHIIAQEAKEAVFIIYPVPKGIWRVMSVPQSGYKYKTRGTLPSSWAGKKGGELQVLTKVEDAVFCHRECFTAGAETKSGILKLAQLAIKERELSEGSSPDLRDF